MAGKDAGDGGRVFDGGRQTHTAQTGGQRRQPRERQHQLIAPLAFGQRVHLIDDDAAEPGKDALCIRVRHQ